MRTPIYLLIVGSISVQANAVTVEEFHNLAKKCAPKVSSDTLLAVVKQESGLNPYAIGINSKYKLKEQPRSKAKAIQVANKLLSQNVNFDAGIAQINSGNFDYLKIPVNKLFDVCENLKAAQRIMIDCYKIARNKLGNGQVALQHTLSCYNTGTLSKGFRNGYVSSVLAKAEIVVPAIKTKQVLSNKAKKVVQVKPVSQDEKQGLPDLFTKNSKPDLFSK